jgi:hypothetical protein
LLADTLFAETFKGHSPVRIPSLLSLQKRLALSKSGRVWIRHVDLKTGPFSAYSKFLLQVMTGLLVSGLYRRYKERNRKGHSFLLSRDMIAVGRMSASSELSIPAAPNRNSTGFHGIGNLRLWSQPIPTNSSSPHHRVRGREVQRQIACTRTVGDRFIPRSCHSRIHFWLRYIRYLLACKMLQYSKYPRGFRQRPALNGKQFKLPSSRTVLLCKLANDVCGLTICTCIENLAACF